MLCLGGPIVYAVRKHFMMVSAQSVFNVPTSQAHKATEILVSHWLDDVHQVEPDRKNGKAEFSTVKVTPLGLPADTTATYPMRPQEYHSVSLLAKSKWHGMIDLLKGRSRAQSSIEESAATIQPVHTDATCGSSHFRTCQPAPTFEFLSQMDLTI